LYQWGPNMARSRLAQEGRTTVAGQSATGLPRTAALQMAEGQLCIHITAPREDRPSGYVDTSEIRLTPRELVDALQRIGILVPAPPSLTVANPGLPGG
jgi:hypothetical protein